MVEQAEKASAVVALALALGLGLAPELDRSGRRRHLPLLPCRHSKYCPSCSS